jgi:hypothetical protein
MRPSKQLLAALEALRDQDGYLRPESVVAAAKDPDSPLHSHFDWNNDSAAHKHRLEQARALIRSVRVEIKTEERIVRSVAYIRDPGLPAREQGYTPITSIRPRSAVAYEVVAAELARAEAALDRAHKVADVLGLDAEIAAMHDKVVELRTRVAALVAA